jgi:hypothetical protein
MGWRLAAIEAGAPTAGTFTVISPTSHHEQSSGVTFKINGEERRFISQLAKDQKSKVSGSTPRYLYHRGKLKWPFRTHAWDKARCTKRLSLFAIQATQRPTHCKWGLSLHVHNVDTQCGEAARKASHHAHNFEKNLWPLFLDEVTPTRQ